MMRRSWPLVALLTSACGDDAATRGLLIVEPAALVAEPRLLCLPLDEDPAVAGLQRTVTVDTAGFAEGALVSLALDGRTANLGVAQPVVRGRVSFARLTLPQGRHALTALSADGRVASPPVAIDVDAQPPAVAFETLRDGAALSALDDVAPDEPGLQLAVAALVGVEDGQEVRLALDGRPAATATAAGGRATATVTIPDGTHQLAIDAATRCGNAGRAALQLSAGAAQLPCALLLEPAPQRGYLSAAADLDGQTAGLQARARVATAPGATVELSLLGASDLRALADGGGGAAFALTLPDGPATIVARCRGAAGATGPLAQAQVVVDTVAPTCRLLAPSGTLGPDDDVDPGDPDVDFVVRGAVGGPDVDGEPATVTVDGVERSGTVAGNAVAVAASLAAPQAAVPLALAARDHAGNRCSAQATVGLDTAGCALRWTRPEGDVVSDADATRAGVQTELAVEVDAACEGREVRFSGCAAATATATGGAARALATVCDRDLCPRTRRTCTASVTSVAGVTTAVARDLTVDTQPPLLAVGGVPCGGTVVPGDDVDGGAAGVQLHAIVLGLAVERWLELAGARIDVDAAGAAVVTVAPGANRLIARGVDEGGLAGASPACEVTLAELRLTVDAPPPVVSAAAIDVCGTVGEPEAATVTVALDGGAALVAELDGARFCARGLAVDEGAHVASVQATTGTGHAAAAQRAFTVDRTPPAAPAAVTAVADGRAAAIVSFVAPADAVRCTVRGEAATPAVTTSGSEARLAPLPPGRPFLAAVRCADAAGNLSPLAVAAAPIVPSFSVGPPLALDAAALAGGDLDGDGFSDLVAGAPDRGLGEVAILRGGPAGPGDAPDLILRGADAGGAERFGAALAILDWDGDGREDLAVGAPWAAGGAGRVFVFLGGPRFAASGTLDEADADAILDGATWFPGLALLGDSLARGTSGDALVAAAPLARAAVVATRAGGAIAAPGWAGRVTALAAGFALSDAGQTALFTGDLETPAQVVAADAVLDLPGAGLLAVSAGLLRRLDDEGFSVPAPAALAALDADGDGAADLAAASGPDMWVWLLRDGVLDGPIDFAAAVGVELLVEVGDVDGDGLPDLALGNVPSGAVQLLR